MILSLSRKEVIFMQTPNLLEAKKRSNEKVLTKTHEYIMNENLQILDVPKDSKLFLFLTRIQDEVHRYAITYHRNIKAKGALSSILDVVPGIGEVRKKELLKKFGSLKKMKEASVEELSSVVGHEVAEKLFDYLKEV